MQPALVIREFLVQKAGHGGGVHESYTFQCGLVGYFYSPDIDTKVTDNF